MGGIGRIGMIGRIGRIRITVADPPNPGHEPRACHLEPLRLNVRINIVRIPRTRARSHRDSLFLAILSCGY